MHVAEDAHSRTRDASPHCPAFLLPRLKYPSGSVTRVTTTRMLIVAGC